MPLDVKAAVADALLELIRRKDADKITVKDLVEVCGISRQTFYYHFKDIVDVVEWAAQQGVQRLVRESLNAATPQEALGVFVDFAVESQPLVQRLSGSWWPPPVHTWRTACGSGGERPPSGPGTGRLPWISMPMG